MANLPEQSVWREGIYQLDVNDDVRGGPLEEGGISNLQAKQLADRTLFLKEKHEEAVEDLQEQITQMQGRGGYLTAHDFGTPNPTQQQLTDYALLQIGQTDQILIWDKTHVKNMNNGHVWVLNNTPDTEPPIFEWIDDGLDSVSVANNEGQLGIVTGSLEADGVYIDAQGKMRISAFNTFNAPMVEGLGRDLMKVFTGHGIEEMTTQSLRKEAVEETMAAIEILHNNIGQFDGSGIAQYQKVNIADFLDGMDLDGIAPTAGGSAPEQWNNTYKNNRIVIAGFNTYKGMGSTENTKNHILFVTRHCIGRFRMNATNTNVGGYPASELRTLLEGANGDGSGAVAQKIVQQFGANYLLKINKYFPKDAGNGDWHDCTLFPATELEIFGVPLYGTEGVYESGKRTGYSTPVHFPLYKDGYIYRIKRWHGSRDWYFEAVPFAGSSSTFCNVFNVGNSSIGGASSVGGCAPAFCVAERHG